MPHPSTVELPTLPGPMSGHGMPTPIFDPLQPRLPLRGVTVLAVEDSRFACEALRLMCQRSGARLRRAESLQAAHSHLRLYRPDVVIVDLGLPDGRGDSLIRDLTLMPNRPPVILGTSGSDEGRQIALAAGADGFLDKPLESLRAFQQALLRGASDATEAGDVPLRPDPLALQDDLQRAAQALDAGPDAAAQRYLAGFLGGVARHAHDPGLARAAAVAASAPSPGRLAALRGIVGARITSPDRAFAKPPG